MIFLRVRDSGVSAGKGSKGRGTGRYSKTGLVGGNYAAG
jgi:hypothetical protein